MFLIVAVCGIALFLYLIIKNKEKGLEPPGPKGWPFIGVATQIDPKGLHHSLTKWSEEYGDVFKLRLFGRAFVVLNSYETIYEALVTKGDDFGGRGNQYRMKVIYPGPGITFRDISPRWTALRKLLMQKFKTYGSNLKILEETTTEIYREDVLQPFAKAAETGEPFNAEPILHLALTNIIGSLIFGRNVKALAAGWLKYQELALPSVGVTIPGLIMDYFPWTRFLPGIRSLYDSLITCRMLHQTAILPELKTSREEFNPSDISSFVDELLKHQMDFGTNPEHGGITDDEIYALVFEVFAAGTITTALTMQAMIACLVNKLELQAKVAEQIYQVIGARKPTIEDRSELPLVEATVLEILRYQTLGPTLLPHQSMRDVMMHGFKIHKGEEVLCNIWKICHDQDFWDDPYVFRPERFIQDGKLVQVDHPNRKRLLFFGAGRRACTGENIAKTRLFLLITEILRDFELLPESEQKRPKHDCREYAHTINICPFPYKIRVQPRNIKN